MSKVGQPYLLRKMSNVLWNFKFFGACVYLLGLAEKYQGIESDIWLSLRPLLKGYDLGHITRGLTGISKESDFDIVEDRQSLKVFFLSKE